MHYVLSAENPLQLIVNLRTRRLSIRTGVVTRNCIFLRFNLNGESFRANSRFRSDAGVQGGQLFFSQVELESKRAIARGKMFKITVSCREWAEKYLRCYLDDCMQEKETAPRKSVFRVIELL